jgi:hypothetical protein
MTVFMQGCQEDEVPIQQAKLKAVQKQVESDLPAADVKEIFDQQADTFTTTAHPDHPIIITPPSGSRLTVKAVSALFTLPTLVEGRNDELLDSASAPAVPVETSDAVETGSLTPVDSPTLPQDTKTENSRRMSTSGSDNGNSEGDVENLSPSATAGQVPIDEIAKAHAVGAQKQMTLPNGKHHK